MSKTTFVWLCLAPLALVATAFFVVPMAQLIAAGAARSGAFGYLAILVEPRYRATLINTLVRQRPSPLSSPRSPASFCSAIASSDASSWWRC